jgi:hypothetical protein
MIEMVASTASPIPSDRRYPIEFTPISSIANSYPFIDPYP